MSIYVYFIQRGRGAIKIGVSKDPEARLKDLQTGNQARLFLIAKMPCSSRLEALGMEKYFHKRLGRFRLNGEWFRNGAIDFIRGGSIHYGIEFLSDMEHEAKAHLSAILKETA